MSSEMGTSKAADMVTEACEHCGNAIEFSFNEWRHRATGSIYCKKVRGIRPTPEARPKLPSAPSPAGETASEGLPKCPYCGGRGFHLDCDEPDAVPEPVSTEGLGTCADFPNTPHAKGTCESCDMWTPVAAPIAPAAVSDGLAWEVASRIVGKFPQIEQAVLAPLLKREIRMAFTAFADEYERRLAAKPSAEGDGWIADGVALIAAERTRQMYAEGWTPAHDDTHTYGQLIVAAQDYIAEAKTILRGNEPFRKAGKPFGGWPWADEWWKPSPDPVRNLVKAGALIAAEIDRLKRLPAPPSGQGEKR